MKGLPLAYDRDLQEDKRPVFAARRDVREALAALAVLVGGLGFDRERLAAAALATRCCSRPTRPRRSSPRACRSATRTSRSPASVREGTFDPDTTAAESVAARLGDVRAAVAEAPRPLRAPGSDPRRTRDGQTPASVSSPLQAQ